MVSAASSVVSRFVSDQSVRGSVVGVLRDSFTRAPRVRQLQVQLVVAGWLFHLITLFVSLARKARQIFEVSVSVCVCAVSLCTFVCWKIRPPSFIYGLYGLTAVQHMCGQKFKNRTCCIQPGVRASMLLKHMQTRASNIHAAVCLRHHHWGSALRARIPCFSLTVISRILCAVDVFEGLVLALAAL